MHNRCHESGVGHGQGLGHVGRRAGTARCDDRHRHGRAHGRREFEVESRPRTVGADRGQENLPGTALGRFDGPSQSFHLGGHAAAVRVHHTVTGVNGDHHRLGSEALGELGDEVRVREGRRINGDPVGAGFDDGRGVGDAAHSPAHGEGDGQHVGDVTDHAEQRGRVVGGGRDVEKDQLVGTTRGVVRGEFDGVTDVAQRHEGNALHHPAVAHVEAGNQALVRHRSNQARPTGPLFSGWNCTPRKEPASTAAVTPSENATACGEVAAKE